MAIKTCMKPSLPIIVTILCGGEARLDVHGLLGSPNSTGGGGCLAMLPLWRGFRSVIVPPPAFPALLHARLAAPWLMLLHDDLMVVLPVVVLTSLPNLARACIV